MKRQIPILLTASVVMLSGCTTPIKKDGDAPDGAEYVRWMPEAYKAPVEEQLPRPGEQWWQDFGSDELNSLVETALVNNYDLRVAVARVAQSRAQAKIVEAAQYPTIDLMTSYNIMAPQFGVGSSSDTTNYHSRSTWQAGAMVSYEVDLWGKLGFNSQAAYSQALASEFNREAVALSLVGEVISVYFQVVSLSERIQVSERNLQAIGKVGQGLERKVERGDATLIDLSQQLILKTNTEAQVNSLKLQRERAYNRLAQLVGRTPSTLKITATTIESFKVPVVNPGLPSDLLCRRPDIRKAEAELEGSKADLYAARANLLPSFTLSGAGGYGSYLLQQFAMPQSLFYNITAQLVQRIFDGGKRKAEVQLAGAKNVEKLESYANTVLSSLRDVEDALAGVALTKRQYEALDQSRKRAQKLATMSAKVVERGGMDYVQLYEIQRTVLIAEDSAVSARSDQLRSSVDLYKSIGGGMVLKDDPCLGGGKLPEADARWTEEAEKVDSKQAKTLNVQQPKSQLGVDSKGGLIDQADRQPVGESVNPSVQNVIQ